MPALSFQEEWLDALLSGSKRQTTRPQTDRIKEGAICTIYNQQRRRITDKPLRQMTYEGIEMMEERGYPLIPEFRRAEYHAHLLGKVEITEVYDMQPLQNSHRNAWARADGFLNFTAADTWFTKRYDTAWADRWWTVIPWDRWTERYFLPEPEAI